MSSFTITLPYPPTSNLYWRHRVVMPRSWRGVLESIVPLSMRGKLRYWCVGKNFYPERHTYISDKGEAYRLDVQAAILTQFGGRYPIPLRCRLAVAVILHPPDRRPRDIDNTQKALFDALTAAKVWEDDKLIDRMLVERREKKKGGEIVVTIERMPATAPVQKHLGLKGTT